MKHDRLTQRPWQAIRLCWTRTFQTSATLTTDVDPYDAERHLARLVGRSAIGVPDHGALLDAIKAEAAETPHTQAWFKCRDAVTTEAMALADQIRAKEDQQ